MIWMLAPSLLYACVVLIACLMIDFRSDHLHTCRADKKFALLTGSTWGSALSGHGPTPSEATSVVPFASYGPASRSFPVRQEPQGRLNPQVSPSEQTFLNVSM